MTGTRGLWGFRYDTTHPKINHYKMRFRFMTAKWNAATRYRRTLLLQKLVHGSIFWLELSRGWYQARVHPSSSGNVKGGCEKSKGLGRGSYINSLTHRSCTLVSQRELATSDLASAWYLFFSLLGSLPLNTTDDFGSFPLFPLESQLHTVLGLWPV